MSNFFFHQQLIDYVHKHKRPNVACPEVINLILTEFMLQVSVHILTASTTIIHCGYFTSAVLHEIAECIHLFIIIQ